MQSHANFRVDPKLAALLGENYRSTELAIKELIDNSFDADAEHVWIQLPKPFTDEPITIHDDGTGMTEGEVRNEYLNIASSRISRKGERSKIKYRKVKGRKGIGKFAGLMVASLMEVRTQTRGKATHLKIWRDELLKAQHDLEEVDLPIAIEACDPEQMGTHITLRGINQNYTFPNAERLKQLLVLEYGRQADFKIYVDGEMIDIEDIPGQIHEHTLTLSNGVQTQLRFSIATGTKALKQSGIAIRVGGKVVGTPRYFGLAHCDEVPAKMLKRVYGELYADVLEADVTADWGCIVENSKLLQELSERVQPILKQALTTVFKDEVTLTRTRLRKQIESGLDRLPSHRRASAERLLEKVMHKFYGESEQRIASVLALLLESFENHDYQHVMKQLDDDSNVALDSYAHAFSEFGLVDIALISQQSVNRLVLLDRLSSVLSSPENTDAQIKEIFSHNLWLLGNKYALVSTNQELQNAVDMYLNHRFTNGHAIERPNLLLVQDFNRRFLLLDLKPSDHSLDLQDRRKAKTYLKDLQVYLPQRKIEAILIGGALSSQLVDHNPNAEIKFYSYKGLLSEARVQLNWLIEELKKR